MRANRGAGGAVAILAILLISSIPVSANVSEIRINLSLDGLTLRPGESAMISLTVTNNHSAIRDFVVELDPAPSAPWNITIANPNLTAVYPYAQTTTTLAVDLAPDAGVGERADISVVVRVNGSTTNSTAGLALRVVPVHAASMNVSGIGIDGLVRLSPGGSTTVSIPISNLGNANDTLLLSADQEPNIADWWSSWQANNTPPPPLQPSGNEAISFLAPGSELNISSATTSPVTVNLSSLTSGLEYDLSLKARATNGSTYSWSNLQVVNSTTTAIDVSSSWTGITEGNHTLEAELSNTTTTLASLNHAVCVRIDVAECSASSSGNGTGNGTGNGSGTSIASLTTGRAVPSGWDVKWLDTPLVDVPPNTTSNSRLRISIPSDTPPGVTGLRLWVSSTRENMSYGSLIVVQVTGSVSLSVARAAGAPSLLPGSTSMLSYVVSNQGSLASLTKLSASVLNGPCSATVSTPASRILPSDSGNWSVELQALSTAHIDDICDLSIEATDLDHPGNSTLITDRVTLGALRSLVLEAPSSAIQLEPGASLDVDISVRNNGSENEDISLDITTPNGITATPPNTRTLNRGATGVFTIELFANPSVTTNGTFNFTVRARSTTSSAISSWLNLSGQVLGQSDARITGPPTARVEVTPGGQNVSFMIEVHNDGSAPLHGSLGWSGVPTNVDLIAPAGANSFIIDAGAKTSFTLDFSARSAALAAVSILTVEVQDPLSQLVLANLTVDLVVLGEPIPIITSPNQAVVVGSLRTEWLNLTVRNSGPLGDGFEFILSPTPDHQVSISPSRIDLAAGEERSIVLQILERSIPPLNSTPLTVSMSSETRTWINTDVSLSILRPAASISIDITADAAEYAPESNATGVMNVRNAGQTYDVLDLKIPAGCDAAISGVAVQEIPLNAGQRSVPIYLTCAVPKDSIAGEMQWEFGAHSRQDQGVSALSTLTTAISVANRDGLSAIGLLVAAPSPMYLSPTSDARITITVENRLNMPISASVNLLGDLNGLAFSWGDDKTQPSIDVDLAPHASMTLHLRILLGSTNMLDDRTLIVRAFTQGAGATQQASSQLNLTFAKVEQAPAGLSAPFGMRISNDAGMGLIASGWAIAAFLFLLGVLARGRRRSDGPDIGGPVIDAVMAPTLPAPVPPSIEEVVKKGPKEVSRDRNGGLDCPTCKARLRTPRNKDPPFRFTCPECDEKIRVVPNLID